MSPVIGCLLGLVIIVCLIGVGMKSAERKIHSSTPQNTQTWKEFKRDVGPMTWQERIVSAVFIIAFIAMVAWIASKI